MGVLKNIICERRVYNNIFHAHSHSYAQLLLPLNGTLHINTQLHNVLLDDQFFFLFPPDEKHSFYSSDKNEFLVLDVPCLMIQRLELDLFRGGVYKPIDKRWQALRYLFLSETTSGLDGQEHAINDLFRYAFSILNEAKHPSSIKYIHNHYHQKISMEVLATLEHYHPNYYCEWFQKKTGMKLTAYIQKLRLERAKELLLTTNLPLAQIAFEVGYEHQSSLTRLFHQNESMSPKLYRYKFRK